MQITGLSANVVMRPRIHVKDLFHRAHRKRGVVLRRLDRDAGGFTCGPTGIKWFDRVFLETVRSWSWESPMPRPGEKRFNSSTNKCNVHRAQPSGGNRSRAMAKLRFGLPVQSWRWVTGALAASRATLKDPLQCIQGTQRAGAH